MPSPTVRIRSQTHARLKEIAKQSGQPMPEVLDRALDAYYRNWFLEEVNKAYAKLRADPKAWAQELAERAEWECTLMDGLEDDPW